QSIQFPADNIVINKILKPFFNDLISSFPVTVKCTYENVRSILLNGECQDKNNDTVQIEIEFPNYFSTFIAGINSGDDLTVKKIVSKIFLSNDDLPPCDGNCTIAGRYGNDDPSKNLLRVIPAPVSGNIKVINADGQEQFRATNGFIITIDGLVNESVATKITEKPVSDDYLTLAETFYDNYKTQFINRKDAALADEKIAGKNLRKDAIVPEFFKLFALLALEAFYASDKIIKIKHGEKINPDLSPAADGNLFAFSYPKTIEHDANAGSWKPDDSQLESTIGQLNYFYNSGLRLPDLLDNKITQSLFSILGQQELVTPLPNQPVDVHIKFKKCSDPQCVSPVGGNPGDTYEITNDVFADDSAKASMWQFTQGFSSPGFLLSNLRNEFTASNGELINFKEPFNLVPVTIGIQNSKVKISEIARFFELPKKLAQHALHTDKYSFGLNYANYDNDKIKFAGDIQTNAAKYLNIEIKVKIPEGVADASANKILEVENVYVDDLNLIYSLFQSKDTVDNIDFYYKPEKPQSDTSEDILLQRIILDYDTTDPSKNGRATILKTNLSPRTSPPLFDITGNKMQAKLKADGENLYWENSNANTGNFIRLLWEAVTTNNGGYFLIVDKDKLPAFQDKNGNPSNHATIIVSFSGAQDKVPSYFNSYKVDNAEIINGLADRSHYLFINNIKLNDADVNEYHPTVPAHTAAFQLLRNRTKNPSSNYRNYLPLEYSLGQKGMADLILTADAVLPIMPVNSTDNIQDHYEYNHLTPLVIQEADDSVGANYKRYSTVGITYNINVNLRDVFGFRTNDSTHFLATREYTHYYFDKIIPVDAWPLIKFSYWVKSYDVKTDTLYFNLS
ncbi:MAG TPA: hypothetical protein VK588_13600, partial [Chitinophagaceae bacterium]|nr:hypothetical protein [Chitinophagaceae bacterium]